MEFAYTLSGNAPKVKSFQIAATVSTRGIPLLIPAADGAGLALPTATSAANMVGMNLDTAVFGTVQNADGSDPAAIVKVIVNPDAVYRIQLSGSATSGTALTAQTENTGSATGLVVTTGFDYNTNDVDEGTIWGLAGANQGIARKITSTTTTSATVTVAFPQDIAVGDTFLHVPFHPFQSASVTLTSAFDEIDASVALSASAAELVPIMGFVSGNLEGLKETTDSFAFVISGDHVLSNRPT